MIRVALAGSVFSSKTTLECLYEHGLEVVGVLGYEPAQTEEISGYESLRELARLHQTPYSPFIKINDHAATLRSWNPDVFFVVGLSQLVNDELLSIPRLGSVGFHPTCLPRGRGRAPIAWLVLRELKGAATFFVIGSGVDDGPLLAQQEFHINPDDDATSVCGKIDIAIRQSLARFLPTLREGYWNPIPQNDQGASYYGKRVPEDGWIDWCRNAHEIDRLIKATTRPHPGAYTFLSDYRVRIWKSEIDTTRQINGVPGRILTKDTIKGYLVQCADYPLWLREVEIEGLGTKDLSNKMKVGVRLGYYSELEIFQLRARLARLEEKLR